MIRNLEAGSAVYGQLPRGCQYCARGSKLVLLTTGLCKQGCFYCPLSKEKTGKDVVYADEMPVESDEDILTEAHLIRAEGTGVTGGDPLLVVDRTERYIRLLKENFGEEHHIHLYTATFDLEAVKKLAYAGLDEIRFHPAPSLWKNMDPLAGRLKKIMELPVDVGFEIPALPDLTAEMKSLVSWLDHMGVLFINLNELEFSETNYGALLGRGYVVRDEVSAAISGSRESAMDVLAFAEDEGLSMAVHFCSATFKDSVQLRNRLLRRAETIARAMDVVTRDGTILKGVVEAGDMDPREVLDRLVRDYHFNPDLVAVDEEKHRVEVAPWLLEKKAKKLPWECYLVEEYPTFDRLEVERVPLEKKGGKRRLFRLRELRRKKL